ncbi:unnamed protein product [Parnassius mnemosyne]|uniref:Pol-like protein n=1 Tax=Parnassius mnemosyne TaxID=213953 RepID=A0AAV1LW95_9NEOP
MIAGDFNGHHTNWSYKSDQRGIHLFDSSLENGFTSINNGEATRVKLVNNVLRKSSPDITFVSCDIAINFKWQVLNENLGSDHLIIKLSMSFKDYFECNEKRNFKQADWKLYNKDLINSFSERYNHDFSTSDIQNSYDYLLEQINISANKNIPVIRFCSNPASKFKPKKYWCPALSKTVAERRLALSTFRKNPTPNNYAKLEEMVTKAKNEIQKAKSHAWKKFCNEIDASTTVSDMWKKMRWFKGYQQVTFHPSEDKKKDLLRSLTPDSALGCPPQFVSCNKLLQVPFTKQELDHSLKKKNSAPGNDGVTYSMVFNLPPAGKKYLLYLYNDIFRFNMVPKQWRTILVVPIPKAGAELNSETKLRPISLISCLCKIFHNMLGKRIEWYVENHNILSSHTNGFRKAQSCLDCLSRLVTYTQLGFTSNIPTAACFLDIENAYNNILVDKVVKTLDEIGIGKGICNYLWSFLSERYLMIKNEKKGYAHDIRCTNRGLAQGDPISPLLFNIVTFRICRQIQNVFVSQYADDFVFYVSDKNLQNCENNLQTAVNAMIILLDEIGLQLSASKSKLCVFIRGYKRREITLSINNNIIPVHENVKYLGLWLDKSLRWTKHVNEIVEKTSKFLNILKVLSGPAWGVHPKHMRTIYISLLRSRLDFGCFLYDNSAKTHLSKLDKIQNKALRIMGGFIKSTPIHVMESELGIQPLFVRRQYLAYKYCIKNMSWTDNATIKILNDLSSVINNRYWHNKKKPLLLLAYDDCKLCNIHNSYPLQMFKLNIWVSYIDINETIQVNLDCVQKNKNSHEAMSLRTYVLKEIDEKYANWHQIFTDGSKNRVGLGAAYCHPKEKITAMFRTELGLSIMTMELVAISEALKYISNLSGQYFVIFSDSKSALQHLARCASGHSRGAPIAYGILNQLYNYRSRYINIKLQWVPSHIGLKGNEEADLLAKAAITHGIELNILPIYTEILTKFKNLCYDKFREYFDERSREKGIWYKTIQSQPLRIPWYNNIKMNRNHIIVIHRLRSGHYPNKKFVFLMKKADSPNCDICHIVEDVQHMLAECVKYQRERENLVQKFSINLCETGWFLSILAEPHSAVAKSVSTIFLPH